MGNRNHGRPDNIAAEQLPVAPSDKVGVDRHYKVGSFGN